MDERDAELDSELSRYAKTTLSWMVAAELLKLIDEPQAVLQLRPGGDQYDTLVLSSFDEQAMLHLNRDGANALVRGELVEFIWPRAAFSPSQAARYIVATAMPDLWARFSAGDAQPSARHPHPDKPHSDNLGAVTGAARIAQFLSEDLSESGGVTWGWIEGADGDGAHRDLDQFALPDAWREVASPTQSSSWAAWLWMLYNKNGLRAVVSLHTGEILDKSGAVWGKWRNPLIADESGLPTAPIAYELAVQQWGSSHTSTQSVRPSVARGMYKVATEDGDTAHLTPVTQLTSLDDVREVWRSYS